MPQGPAQTTNATALHKNEAVTSNKAEPPEASRASVAQRIESARKADEATVTVTTLWRLYLTLGHVSDRILELVCKRPIRWKDINWEMKTYKFLGREYNF